MEGGRGSLLCENLPLSPELKWKGGGGPSRVRISLISGAEMEGKGGGRGGPPV